MNRNDEPILKVRIEEFKLSLKRQLTTGLPGFEAQVKLAPLFRLKELEQEPPCDAIISSVLLLLYLFQERLKTLVILRAEYDGFHSGQISLPGGRVELSDTSLSDTALRETHEETGMDISGIELLGPLSRLYINRSNYIVFPFVGITAGQPVCFADPIEVQEIIEVDIHDMLQPGSVVEKKLRLKDGFTLKAPGYQMGNHFIWGATAMIFSEFLEVIRSME